MATKQPNIFIDPTNPNSLSQLLASQKATRNQELALALKKKLLEQQSDLGKTQVVSGVAVRNSPLIGLANLLQSYGADKMLEQSDNAIAQQKINQEMEVYNRLAPTTQKHAPVQQQEVTQPILSDTATTQPVVEPEITSEVIPAQPTQNVQPQQFTPSPKGLKNPFSWQADEAPPPYTGQPISIANNNGSVSQLAGMLRPPVNDVRPLPIDDNKTQTPSALAQLVANPNANIQMPAQPQAPVQRQVNAFNVNNIDNKVAYTYSKLFPEEWAKYNLNALAPTNLQRENEYLGIDPVTARNNALAKARKDSYIAPEKLEGGTYYRNPNTGSMEYIQPTVLDEGKTYIDPKTGKERRILSPQYDPDLQGRIATAQAQGKAGVENENTFIDQYDPVTGGTKSVTKQQALNQGGFISKPSEANTQLQKDYATHYNTTLQTGYESRQKLPKIVERLSLINQTNTGLGVSQQNAIKDKLAGFGIKLPAKGLTNQQLLEAELYVDTLSEASKLKPASDTDIKILKDTVGSINTNPEALRKLTYKRLGQLGQDIFNAGVSKSNVEQNGGFSKYQDVYSTGGFDKSKFILQSLNSNKELRNQYFMSLSPQERKAILNQGK